MTNLRAKLGAYARLFDEFNAKYHKPLPTLKIANDGKNSMIGLQGAKISYVSSIPSCENTMHWEMIKKERQAGLAEDQIWEWRDARLGRHQAEVIYTYCGYWCNLKLYILGGLGRVETRLQNQGDNLKDIRESINWIVVNTTATKSAKGESSVRTAYENDDREFWRDLRRQLLKERFLGAAVQRKQSLIRAYVTALAKKEVLDEDESDGDEASMNTKEAASDSQARILEDIIKSQKEDSG
ncbi:hypothetical protein G7Y89_g13027 [Cudoniella acicularis]|uniref:Uncharacterized protein n=1 Tax=Cudoniella acicularis TaxID=354080 RepID=A0A8H4R851_9HELO|nr:hypothetical protein G7Y89_g13027 [Cudoniella acicularis]